MRTNFDDDALFRGLINNIPDWPKPGVIFRDIQPLLGQPDVFLRAISNMDQWVRTNVPESNLKAVVAIESRGFIFGAALAMHLGIGLVLARKAGKLPGDVVAETYDLEYGKATLELGRSAIRSGASYVIVDDVLATGNTVRATANLIKQLGGEPKAVLALIELAFLQPRLALMPLKTHALVTYTTPT